MNFKNTSESNEIDLNNNRSKTLIFYCYFEKNDEYIERLNFFFEFGFQANLDYVLIIQGHKCSVRLPNRSNLIIIRRKNNCFDFGAYGYAIYKLGGELFLRKYDFFIFLNPSVIGPILPKYFPNNIHWSEIFTSRLKNDVHVVGTSIVCLPNIENVSEGPKIEGMAFAATSKAILIALRYNIFSCKKTKTDAILNGEYEFTNIILKNGMNIDTLLLKYGKIDWRKKKNWNCNNMAHPTRFKQYDEISVHPLEVIFHKPLWDIGNSTYLHDVYLNETKKYIKWARNRKIFS